MKVSAVLVSAKTPPSNLTIQERTAVTSLGRDPNITILPADKGKCTVILNTNDCKAKVNNFLKDTATYEILKRDLTSSYKKKGLSVGTVDHHKIDVFLKCTAMIRLVIELRYPADETHHLI
ncbi:hypothetical protein E2320_002281 [Naja naja]|nr:hypothetical protein E2320_002281 [Naja naja]